MNYVQKLRTFIGDSVQVVTGLNVITGELLGVTNSTLTVLAASEPGYGGGETVVFQLDRITYVRVL
ncbi:hypothetical protein [Brevibacillus fortis]|uniref:hypothetical protein n=1 Tax=Brevibacillus fortis TaxID=2126352 RepID=UPI0038FD2075